MNREIIRARDMASALELAERKLGADVLIVKSSDLGGHVEIEVERGKPIKDKKEMEDKKEKDRGLLRRRVLCRVLISS